MADDVSLGKIAVELELRSNQINEQIAQLKSQLGGIEQPIKKATEATNGLEKAFGTMKSRFVSGMTIGLGLMAVNTAMNLITSSISQAINSAIKWEAAMWRIETVTGEVVSQMVEVNGVTSTLEDSLKRIADNSFFGRAETVKAYTEFAKQGFSAVESLQALEAAQALAIVGMTDMTTAINITATTLHAYNLNASEAWRVTDVLAKAANISALDVEDFGVALGYVGAFAKQAGYDIEQTAAILAVLSNQGLDASQSATYLRQAFIQMASPSTQAQEALNKLGVTFETSSGQFKDMNVIAAELAASFDRLGYTDFQKTQAVIEIFGARASTAILSLVRNVDSLNESLEEMATAGGTAQEALERYADTAEGAIKKFQARTEGTLQDFGQMWNEFWGNEIRGAQRLLDPIWEARERAQEGAGDIRQQYTELGIDSNLWAKSTRNLTNELTALYAKTKLGRVDMGQYSETLKTLTSDTVSLEEKLALLQEQMGSSFDMSDYNELINSLTYQSTIISGNFDGLVKKTKDLGDSLAYIRDSEKLGGFYDEKTLTQLEKVISDTSNYADALKEIMKDPELKKAWVDRGGTEEELQAILKLYREYNDKVNVILEETADNTTERAKRIADLSAEYSDSLVEVGTQLDEAFGNSIGTFNQALTDSTAVLADLAEAKSRLNAMSDTSFTVLGLNREEEQLKLLTDSYQKLIELKASGKLTEDVMLEINTSFSRSGDVFADLEGDILAIQKRLDAEPLILNAKFTEPKDMNLSELESQLTLALSNLSVGRENMLALRLNVGLGDIKQQARDIAKETGRDFDTVFKELKIDAFTKAMEGGFEDSDLALQALTKNLGKLGEDYTSLSDIIQETGGLEIAGFSGEELAQAMGVTTEELENFIKTQQEAAKSDELARVADLIGTAMSTAATDMSEANSIMENIAADNPAAEAANNIVLADDKMKQSQQELIDYMGSDFVDGWANSMNAIIDTTENGMNAIINGLEAGINAAVDGINHLISEYNSLPEELRGSKVSKLGKVSLSTVEIANIDTDKYVVINQKVELDGQVVAKSTNRYNAKEQDYYPVR